MIKVSVTYPSGEGTTFFVELPLEAKLAEPIEKTEK